MRKIIIISGKKQSGKDTFARMLAAQLWDMGHRFATNDGARLYYDRKVGFIRAVQSGDLTKDNDHLDKGCTISEAIELQDGIGNEQIIAGVGVRLMHFSGPLKEFCIRVLGLDRKLVYGNDEAKNTRTHIKFPRTNLNGRLPWIIGPWGVDNTHMTVREVLQFVGTEICRTRYADCWVNATAARINETSEPFTIVCDGRFRNELLGLELLIPDSQIYRVRLLRNPSPDTHTSETALDEDQSIKWDMTIAPDATLEQMETAAITLAAKVLVDAPESPASDLPATFFSM